VIVLSVLVWALAGAGCSKRNCPDPLPSRDTTTTAAAACAIARSGVMGIDGDKVSFTNQACQTACGDPTVGHFCELPEKYAGLDDGGDAGAGEAGTEPPCPVTNDAVPLTCVEGPCL
jgi:hypothetical protein